MAKSADSPLTPRQVELLAYVASGSTIDEAASSAFIARQSAYNILSVARSKAGCATLTQLAVVATVNGWIEADGEGHATPAAELQPAA